MNIFDYNVPKIGEDFTTLFEHKNIKINRIVSSDTLEKKVYIQNEDEWLVLLHGEATIKISDELKTLKIGNTLFIPSKTPHEVIQTSSGTLWLTVHIF